MTITLLSFHCPKKSIDRIDKFSNRPLVADFDKFITFLSQPFLFLQNVPHASILYFVFNMTNNSGVE